MDAAPLKNFIYSSLNQRFLRFSGVTGAMFSPSGFTSDEAAALARLCADVQSYGYEFIEANLGNDKFSNLFHTATEYGGCVEPAIGESYLGMYVVAQMLTQAIAVDGYCKELVSSRIFQGASEETRQAVQSLMLLATFVQDKVYTDPKDQYYMRCCTDLQCLNLGQLDPLAAMRALGKDFGA